MGYKNLLLQGHAGIGKSTIIMESIIPYMDFVGGYYTQRVLDGKEKVGFLVSPVESKEDYVLNKAIKDLKPDEMQRIFAYKNPNGTWAFDNEIFVDYSMRYLSKGLQQRKKLLIADELGGMEFQNGSFFREIAKIFLSDVPVLGVLKSSCNFHKLQKATLLETPCKNLEQFKSLVSRRATVILLAPGKDGNEAIVQVQAFIKKSIMVGN